MNAKTKNQYSSETCERLSKQLIDEFRALDNLERTSQKADALLYDLAHFYMPAPDTVKLIIEQTFMDVCKESTNKLTVMLCAYRTASRVTGHSRLCNVLQNLITETADTLEDWRMVFNNEHPSPSLSKECKKDNNIIPGVLKNVALQQILLKSNDLDDIDLVVRNSTPGSTLHTFAILKNITLKR